MFTLSIAAQDIFYQRQKRIKKNKKNIPAKKNDANNDANGGDEKQEHTMDATFKALPSLRPQLALATNFAASGGDARPAMRRPAF